MKVIITILFAITMAISLQSQEIEIVYDRVDVYEEFDETWYIVMEDQIIDFTFHYQNIHNAIHTSFQENEFLLYMDLKESVTIDDAEYWIAQDFNTKELHEIVWDKENKILILSIKEKLFRFIQTKH